MAQLQKWMYMYRNAGAPTPGTDEVQTLTFADTWTAGDTFVLRYEGETTAAVAWSATNSTLVANIDAALGALAAIGGAGNITTAVGTMTAGIGTITITFAAALGLLAVNTIAVDSVTVDDDGTLEIAETTPGVTVTGKGLPKCSLLVDTVNGALYFNTGTANAPTWEEIAVGG